MGIAIKLRKLLTYDGNYTAIIGIFAFTVLISVGLISTNYYSRSYVEVARYGSIFVALIASILVLLSGGVRRVFLLSSAIYTSFFIYGLVLSILNNVYTLQVGEMITNYIIVLIGLFLFSSQTKYPILHQLTIPYLIFVSFAMLATVQSKGVMFVPMPVFNFEYAMSVSGLDIAYSQGISKFFGIGAIAAAYAITITNCRAKRNLFFIVYLVFMAMSFYGGGRGDSLAALVVSLIFLFSMPRIVHIKVSLFFLVLLIYLKINYFKNEVDISSFLQRFYVIGEGNFGLRDQLLVESFQLLVNNPRCILFGCGFEYFQYNYNYDYGMYPHNFLVESLMSFGLPITFIFGCLVINGIRLYHAKIGGVDFFILYFFYDGIVALKSGALFGAWFFTAGSLFFSALALKKLFFHNR
jgi:hypothetical protein